MSKHNQQGNRSGSNNPPKEASPSDTPASTNNESLDHSAQVATQLELKLFCWWTAPIVEEALSGLIRLDRYPTAETYRNHTQETTTIRKSAAPIILGLKEIEDALYTLDVSDVNLSSLKLKASDLAGQMAQFINASYELKGDILSRFLEAENSASAPNDEITPTGSFSEEDLVDDRNSSHDMLINIPRQKAQALATIRIFAKQDDGISIADVLTGCAFLPYNVAVLPNSQVGARQSEVINISPQIAASAVYTAFLKVTEAQKELFNFCLQCSLLEWEEIGGPDLFFDVLNAIGSVDFDTVNFDQKKILALRALATNASAVRVYEESGEVITSFLMPSDIAPFEAEIRYVFDQLMTGFTKELNSLGAEPVVITRRCGETFELGVSIRLPCSEDLKAHSEETSSIIDLHSREDFVKNLPMPASHISLAINLPDKDLFEIELPREFFIANRGGTDRTELLRNAIDLCVPIKSSSLARIERLPASDKDSDCDSDPGEVTIFRREFHEAEMLSETAVARLARLYKICELSDGALPEDLFSAVNSAALRIPASWLENDDLRTNLSKLSTQVEIADLDLIAFSNDLFEGAALETSTQVLARVTSLLHDFKTNLSEHGRSLLFMPLKASTDTADGSVKFYLTSTKGSLLGVGRIPTQKSSFPTLTLFPPTVAERFGKLVADVTQSLSEASKISGTLMHKVQNAIRKKGVILSEYILEELCDEYARSFSPPSQSDVERIIYAGIAALGKEDHIRADYRPSGSSEKYYLAIFTKKERFYLNPEE
jgi:hypothetical protein